ncbi:MAG: sulfotransferase [Pseudomonadota bacterium]
MDRTVPNRTMSRKNLDKEFAKHCVVGSEPRRDIYGRLGIHPDRLNLRSLPMEAKVWAKSLVQNDAPTPFLIYGRPRSGTTLLVRLLDQLPQVRSEGELLHYFLFHPVEFLRRLPKRAGPDVQAYGVKLISYHLMEIQRIRQPLAFFDCIGAYGYKVIHLTRNTWDQTLSLMKAQESGVYFSNSGSDPQMLHLNPERFLRLLKWNVDMLDYENAVMSHVEHFPVFYDRDLKETHRHQKTIDALSAFLNVAPRTVKSRMQRTGGAKGLQKVANMEEIAAHVRQSELAHLVPDDL